MTRPTSSVELDKNGERVRVMHRQPSRAWTHAYKGPERDECPVCTPPPKPAPMVKNVIDPKQEGGKP